MRYLYWLGLIVIVLVAISIAPNTYYLFILGMVAITTLVGVGLNILTGLSGQISIGHAGFFAIGAYTGSLLMTQMEWNFWLAGAIAVFAAAMMGIALAIPALRVKGPYLAMVTIAFGIIVERILIEWIDLTGGFGGIVNIPQSKFLGITPALRDVVLLAWIVAILALMSFAALKRGNWGRAFQAVRDDEIAAGAIGLNPLKVKVTSFALSAAFTGLGGIFFAAVVGFISPDSFTFHRSILFLLVVILGGLGTVAGALIGAIVLVILPELLHDFADYQLLVFGILLLLTLWLTPEGIVSFFLRRFRHSNPVYPPEATLDDLPTLAIKNQNNSTLEVKRVSISFGGIKAVDQVDLVASAGTVTAAIGPNGAGKTTLLNLICGFYRPQAGSVYLGKQDLTGKNSLTVARAGLSRTFQATRLFNSLSVIDNLRVAYSSQKLGNILTALWGRKKEQKPPAELLALLAFIGYRGDIYARADSLSFGDRRRVEIARALATSPQVLLLDEPAAGLGETDRDWLAKLIRLLGDRGIKVILIEHDMELVMKIADRVVVLDSGKIICTGNPEKVQQDGKVLEAYLGITSRDLSRPLPLQTSPILSINKLVSGYDKLQVLHDISLEVYPGELVAVIGANGAGKTTLLKSIPHLLKPWSGHILFQGKNLATMPAHYMAAAGIILVPEGRQVFAELTVTDNLRLGAFHRRDHRQINQDLEAMWTRFPRLQERRDRLAGLLSGGEQQMLAIARGLMAKPKILLLDEPSLGLAPQLVTSLYETLARLRDEGITILLVDRMAKLALSVADHLYLLETGRIVKSGTPDQMQEDSIIAQSYLGNAR